VVIQLTQTEYDLVNEAVNDALAECEQSDEISQGVIDKLMVAVEVLEFALMV
jgi:hypothetical protein